MNRIESIAAREILDSRGRPTVEATCMLSTGETASASVPSGASTGKAEALELRDHDPQRYAGLGCRKAVANVNGPIARAVRRKQFISQEAWDGKLLDLDGTANKSRLGANAILACSLAFARAVAARRRQPLYTYFASLFGAKPKSLPRLTINLFSGGKHAGGQVAIQDVLLVSMARTIDQGLADAYAVYYAAAKLVQKKYKMRLLRADEGGLAPPAASVEEILDDAVQSIKAARLRPGKDIVLALDVASSHFFRAGKYHIDGAKLTSAEMIARIQEWTSSYPIVSVEDGLAENDWSAWPRLMQTTHTRALILGDDFLCTNPARIQRAITDNCANALLLKVNQIGTLTEAAEARRLAKQAVWNVTVSARSGETEDNWLADLAVAWGDQIKVGSITQGERLAKYNRLLEIERETHWPVNQWPRD